jgi:DNA recombination protein RmuC
MDSNTLLIIVAVAVLVVVVLVVLRGERGRAEAAQRLASLVETAERLAAAQSELGGRLQQTQSGLNERLDSVSKRLADGLAQQTEKTGDTLKTLHERLAVIDAAQKNITDLSHQVVGLQDILSNKQARGAHGQTQMENLVRDALPPSAYQFQAKLSNGRMADCLLKLPNPPGGIVIDSKYPLERYRAFRGAADEAQRSEALRAFGADVLKHVRDISEKYIVAGETAESALMFLPSEAVYAELHASLPEVVDKSYRARVWIVSPTTLMATLNTVRSVLKDARMREQAGVIQAEVLRLLGDVGRLDQRVDNLQNHFRLATKDIDEIQISSRKISARGDKIESMQLEDESPAEELAPAREPIERIG